ncbi:DegT/DnrJ/EryC1/StrS family aminotransferase [Pseudanabaena sp. UWO310]|uniref:DegT/DnrJ/EryC1/StrS family aminotransferase n=1 Tax=Pseudanabaena sp. UWO310 TaxID=2480795 RepID=UPI001156D19E|nr:DegT/DnrJ/EryC1/StrS family aminotransferase [Pseudanabaena sp. UWO310]TYQ27675.1 DegT/DnrJ/EryC1/StrS family aminotransferase [Pseudanabaena sp. UWO310]
MFRKDYLPFGKPNFSEQEIAAISEVLNSGWIGMGAQTNAFEEELAECLAANHVVTVSSCTAALFLSLLVLGVQAGDEVICPSLTWCSTANVALYLGATPVFCDVDPETYCVTPESIQQKLTPKTKAVIVVHLGGLAQDMEKIHAIIPEGVSVVEDAAHALGSNYPNGKPVGSSGNLTCFSFYANKNLSTGEGGAIALFDEELTDRLKSLRQHGMPINAWKRFTHPKVMIQAELTELGYKMNYTDLQACIGRVQLKRQSEFAQTRLEIAQYYYEHLKISHPQLIFQQHVLNPFHARHLFLIQLPSFLSRDNILLELRERNIGASIHYPPLHKMPLYAKTNKDSLPFTETICSHILTLPISAKMNIADASYVVEQLQDLLSKGEV